MLRATVEHCKIHTFRIRLKKKNMLKVREVRSKTLYVGARPVYAVLSEKLKQVSVKIEMIASEPWMEGNYVNP